MKKVFAILSIVAIFNFGSTLNVVAQDSTATEQVAATDSAVAVAVTDTTQVTEEAAAPVAEEGGMHKKIMGMTSNIFQVS